MSKVKLLQEDMMLMWDIVSAACEELARDASLVADAATLLPPPPPDANVEALETYLRGIFDRVEATLQFRRDVCLRSDSFVVDWTNSDTLSIGHSNTAKS